MKQIDPVLTDRGSKYAVTGSEAKTKADALAVLKQLKPLELAQNCYVNVHGFKLFAAT